MKIGNKEVDIKQYRNDWALALMSQGIIVKLNVSRWRGMATLKAEELGLKFHDAKGREFMDNYISLGRERLLPPDVNRSISAIERQARENLKGYSFPTVWGNFVPFSAFDRWEEENERIKQSFKEMSNTISEQYYDIIDRVKTAYVPMANDVWGRLYPDSSGGPTSSFVQNFVNNIAEKIPSRIDVVSSFKYNVTYFVIPMPSIIEENLSRARKKEMEREMEEFQVGLERKTKERVAEEYVKKKQELIDGFLESTVCSMRKYVADLCNSVLQSMSQQSKTKNITRIQKNKIKKTIDKVKLLNFYDDKEMTSLLSNLETEIDKFKGERDRNEIVIALGHIVAIGTKEFIPQDFNPSISSLEL